VLGRLSVDTSAHGFPVLLEPLHHGSLYWWQTFGSCRAIYVVAMLSSLRRETVKFLQGWLFLYIVIEIKMSDVSINGPSNDTCLMSYFRCHVWHQALYRPYCHLCLTDGNRLQGLPRCRSWQGSSKSSPGPCSEEYQVVESAQENTWRLAWNCVTLRTALAASQSHDDTSHTEGVEDRPIPDTVWTYWYKFRFSQCVLWCFIAPLYVHQCHLDSKHLYVQYCQLNRIPS